MKCESDGKIEWEEICACLLGKCEGWLFQSSMLVGIVRIHGNICRSLYVLICYGFCCSWRYRFKELVI